MDRRHFLESIGIGAAFALTATCLQSCKHEFIAPATTGSTNNNTGTTTTNTAASFTINLDDPANASLKSNGGYIVVKGIVIAKDLNGNYVAVTQVCSHANRAQIVFSSANEFYCNAHGARFTTAGVGLNSAGRGGLQTYKTVLEGTAILRVFN